MTTALPELKSLTVSERIQMVEDIWDSIAMEVPESLHLTEAQEAEVSRRVEAHMADPSSAVPWTEVRRKLFAPQA